MKLYRLITTAIEELRQAGIDNPQLDARLLIGDTLNLDRAELLSQAERELSPEEVAAAKMLLFRRVEGEPVARILGHREFWGLNFGMNEATLEPRPDTETVVETVLKLHPDAKRILDLGAGTGCLLLALLHDLPEATGLGIDISPRAVTQASINAVALELDDRAEFRAGNWIEGLTEQFDVIVSNPPYIPSAEIQTLMPEVRDYDPLQALDGGEDGLDPYRALIPQLKDILRAGGLVAFEVGQGQAAQIADLFRQNDYTSVSTHKDLAGIDRCVSASL